MHERRDAIIIQIQQKSIFVKREFLECGNEQIGLLRARNNEVGMMSRFAMPAHLSAVLWMNMLELCQ